MFAYVLLYSSAAFRAQQPVNLKASEQRML